MQPSRPVRPFLQKIGSAPKRGGDGQSSGLAAFGHRRAGRGLSPPSADPFPGCSVRFPLFRASRGTGRKQTSPALSHGRSEKREATVFARTIPSQEKQGRLTASLGIACSRALKQEHTATALRWPVATPCSSTLGSSGPAYPTHPYPAPRTRCRARSFRLRRLAGALRLVPESKIHGQ